MFRIIQRIKDKWRNYVLSVNVAHLFNTIGKDDILEQIGTTWYIGERELGREEMKKIVAEALVLKHSMLWKVINNDIRYQANLRMFEESKDLGDLTMGKSWLWVLDCIKTRINELADPKKNNIS